MAFAEEFRKVSHEKYVSASCTEEQPKINGSPRPKLFYSYGCSLLTITHFICAKAKNLPFPFGQLAAGTENTLGSWFQPVVGSVEGLGLKLLSIADYQLSLIGNVAEYILPSTSVLFEKAQKIEDFTVKMPDMVIMTVDKLSVRGVTGSIADLWVKYEADGNGQIDKVLRMAENVPLLNPIAGLVNSAVSPFIGSVSDWMLKHSEVEVKEVSPNNIVAKGIIDIPIDASTHEVGSDNQLLQRTEPMAENFNADVPKDEQHSNKMLQQDDVKTSGVPKKAEETASDPILELFDSSWHMGSSIISPKTRLSPKKKAGK